MTSETEISTVPQSVDDFARRLADVHDRMRMAAEKVGRDSSEVRLLAVSKTVAEDRLRNAVAAGAHELGENKVQEAARKHQTLADLDIAWAIIGHLQTNKARTVAEIASEFQALDSTRVAEALDRRLQALGRGLAVYIQVNTSAEESKSGLIPEDVPGFLKQLRAYSSLQVQGFMTLAANTRDEQRVRSCFRMLRRIRDEARDSDPDLVGPGGLSMGMSGDFELAIEEGSTVVRVGQAIFGPRPAPHTSYWPAAFGGHRAD
ncbi:YggS family pyridoxal phosphate-dependent enzyme [Brooklawnia cerclae]|uniref:Pyridoxal phosphate homeostasis protein n=1 Tax=Brooklawnia cerclae TaxID=349934 RepID=A0ABX0SII6_9ACTN|nr:hypothetical protein [Brooklawnia cerclae]